MPETCLSEICRSITLIAFFWAKCVVNGDSNYDDEPLVDLRTQGRLHGGIRHIHKSYV